MRCPLPPPASRLPPAPARRLAETSSHDPRNPVSSAQPPIITVTAPGGITTPPPAVGSPIRAAGIPPIITVADPMTMASAPQLSPRRAAGIPPMSTVGAPGGIIGTGAPMVAVLTIMSVTRAAGGMVFPLSVAALTSIPFPTRARLAHSVDLHHAALNHGRGAALYRHARTRYLGF